MTTAPSTSVSTQPLRWGVLGARSRIYAKALEPAFQQSDRHQVIAGASRDADGGTAPYDRLLARGDVDAIYIPLPNIDHKTWILRSLAAGKHVLCEKPLTLNPADTDEVFAAAQAADLVLLEAYMWPHHARSRRTLELCASGELGSMRSTHSVFSFPFDRVDDHRLDRRGAGALFDVGIYCLAPAMMIAGRDALRSAASAVRNDVGVDVSMSGWVDWGEGFTSTFEVSFDGPNHRRLDVTGTAGMLTVPDWHAPGPIGPTTLGRVDRLGMETSESMVATDAYEDMIDHFADVVAGETAPVFGAAESGRLARVLDMVHASAP